MRTEFVTTLKRKATKIIAELEDEREPVLITQHGRPAAYLVSIKTYSALNQRLRILEGIARGERAIQEGRVISHAEARKRLRRWLSSSRSIFSTWCAVKCAFESPNSRNAVSRCAH